MNTSANARKWLVVSIVAALATMFSSKAQSSTCAPAPSGLVSWWQAEGNGLDGVGGNTAYAPVLPGGVTFGPGEVGQGFQLNGTNAYLMVPASPSLNVGTGSGITMEGWIKVSSVDGLHPIAEWYSDVRDVLGVQLWINSSPFGSGGLLAVLIDTNSNQQALTSPQGILQPNVFQHVAMTYDQASGITKIYLNGAAVAQANMGSFVPQTSYNLWIGHRPFDRPGDWTYGATLGGVLDEFSIYNRALSADEIASIYNAGAAGKCDGSSSGIAPALTGQPTNQTVTAGANVTFTVTATGSQPLHYEWYGPDNFEIPGAETSTLTLSNVQPANAGAYYAFVTNQFGFAQSSNAVLTVTGATTNSNPGTPPLDGLVAWWKGENNTLDSEGTNNGVVTRGSISYAPGEVGSAFQYDDSSGYVAVPPTPPLNVGQGSGFTLEAWIQPADLQNQLPIFEWEYNTNTAADGVHFWISAINGAGCLFANLVDSSFNSHWINSAPGLITADYQHVALTYDKSSGVASIYRNGVLVATQNLGSFTPDTTGNLLLGERTYLNNEPQYHYVGGLDEMSVYSRALSQSEIAAIYDAGSAGKGGSTNSNSSGPTQLVLPNYSATNQVYNPAGSLNQPLRMQMLYGASQFPSHPIVITEIRWRPDVNVGGPLSVIVSNLQIKLSTTVATPDHLSTVFTQNTGTNETVAYSGAASISTAFTTLSNGTKAFDIRLPLQTPFAYDPSKGNLLVDLRNLYGCIPARSVEQNIVNSTGEEDAVSRVFSIDPNATTAETADTGADVLELIYTAATNTTNSGGGGETNSCTPAPSGLVSWWPGEGNGNDVVGSNNAIMESGVTFAPGKVGQAFQLTDYTDGFMHVPASPSLNIGTGSGITLEAWINVASVDGLHPIAEWYSGVRDILGVQFWINSSPFESGGLLAVLYDTDGNRQALTSPQGILQPNTFQHVAMTYDRASGMTTIYLNGAAVAQANMGSFVPQTSYNLWIGHRPFDVPGDWTYGATLGGLLDEFSIYNRALSSNEIAAIYHAGANGKCAPTNSSTGTAPAITSQPTNQTVNPGANVTFSVTAAGSSPLHYEWYGPDNLEIPGANSSTLTLSNVQLSDAGSYYAFVTNSFGFAQSSNAVLTVTGGQTNSSTLPPSGIAAWWRSESNTIDSINGNNGTIHGGVTYVDNVVGHAFLFDGTSGYISVPASPSLNIGAGSGLTIECWVKPNHLGPIGEEGRPIVEYDTASSIGVHFYFESGNRLYANLKDTANNDHAIFSSSGSLSSNVLSHVAVTYDRTNGTCFLYINGVQVASNYFGNFTPQTTYPLSIGIRAANGFPGSGVVYNGVLDELSLYSRALNSSEIRAIFQAGMNGKSAPTNSGTIPTITSQPTNQTVAAGANVTFTATASGTAPLHYEWYGPDNFEIPGADTSTLTLSNVQPANAGAYYVFVTNSFGFAQSSNAVLTITNPPMPLCVTAPTNIAAWWPAEGNGADIIGGATATLQGGATFAPGEVGQAFLLAGTNDYLTATSSNLDVAAGGSFTVEAWINVPDVTDYHPIVEWNDNAGHAGVHLWILPYSGETPGVLFANLVDTGGVSHAFHAPGGSVSTNGFQHVALTYDQSSGIATLYANSNIVAQLPLGSFTPQTSFPLWMGHRPNDAPGSGTYGAHLGGLLDELSLYRRALSQSEIGAIYNAGANGKCPPSQIEPHAAINPQPVVNLSVSGKSPVLSWPASANGFILQSADNLAPPVNWTNVPGIPATNGGNIEMTLPTSGQRGYFRLYHP